ncbi:MAG: DUF3078 domain-containing protein [Flavobacteriaceae bacterium]|mgnify:CR=1 FL=1|nr:DUF3078 domain-containing protein [Mangrovimonas sp.]MCB0425958.1 DUF3078 domain-containing protein [Mangrovimonas sp.]MCB0434099.1 DUF3078 domain-containing protein [Mangrovimonas sp.]MCB0434505.1 DUF3078 domain-containing protein [Mangrovimonas sp.]MCB0438024.1 DUF3078 domain-containing protein [Mangrovimonas sp.]
MKQLITLLVLFISTSLAMAQTVEELKADKKAKEDSIAAIQGRVDALQKQIDTYPGWKFGAFGTVGASLSGFNNWYAQGTPNNSSGNIGLTVNPYAKLDREKYFWYNQGQINLSWVKFDDKDDPTDDDSFKEAADVFNVSSLFGYKFSEKWAASALAEYRTTILNNFNDPGYLDLGVGVTWLPNSDLTVVIHPLNYNFVFSKGDTFYESSLGTKVLATYAKKFGGLDVKSQLSTFLSYKSSDYNNWTWITSLGYKFWKNIGAGFEFGLRGNKQEALNYAYSNWDPLGSDPEPTFGNIDNKLQTYWLFGLNYDF